MQSSLQAADSCAASTCFRSQAVLRENTLNAAVLELAASMFAVGLQGSAAIGLGYLILHRSLFDSFRCVAWTVVTALPAVLLSLGGGQGRRRVVGSACNCMCAGGISGAWLSGWCWARGKRLLKLWPKQQAGRLQASGAQAPTLPNLEAYQHVSLTLSCLGWVPPFLLAVLTSCFWLCCCGAVWAWGAGGTLQM